MDPESRLIETMLELVGKRTQPGDALRQAFYDCSYLLPQSLEQQYALSVPLLSTQAIRPGDVCLLRDGRGRAYAVAVAVGSGRCVELRPHYPARLVTVMQARRHGVFRRFATDLNGRPVTLSVKMDPSEKLYYRILCVADGVSGNQLKRLAASLGVPLVHRLTSRTNELTLKQDLERLDREEP